MWISNSGGSSASCTRAMRSCMVSSERVITSIRPKWCPGGAPSSSPKCASHQRPRMPGVLLPFSASTSRTGVSARCGGALWISTATTRCGPAKRVAVIGNGASRPPSTKSILPMLSGVKMPGMANEARRASHMSPWRNQTSRWLFRSTATAVKSIGSSSMRGSPITSRRARTNRLPVNIAGRLMPGSSSRNIWLRLVAHIQSLSSVNLPAAKHPPTKAPQDVPATAVTYKPRDCSTSITPICASPRAPPPLNANTIEASWAGCDASLVSGCVMCLARNC